RRASAPARAAGRPHRWSGSFQPLDADAPNPGLFHPELAGSAPAQIDDPAILGEAARIRDPHLHRLAAMGDAVDLAQFGTGWPGSGHGPLVIDGAGGGA